VDRRNSAENRNQLEPTPILEVFGAGQTSITTQRRPSALGSATLRINGIQVLKCRETESASTDPVSGAITSIHERPHLQGGGRFGAAFAGHPNGLTAETVLGTGNRAVWHDLHQRRRLISGKPSKQRSIADA